MKRLPYEPVRSLFGSVSMACWILGVMIISADEGSVLHTKAVTAFGLGAGVLLMFIVYILAAMLWNSAIATGCSRCENQRDCPNCDDWKLLALFIAMFLVFGLLGSGFLIWKALNYAN